MSKLEDFRGRREEAQLEFKSKECVRDPRILPRAVCAMLNAKGGRIVVGLREVAGGLALDPVPDVEAARVAVRDRLMDSIEPLPPDALSTQVLDDGLGLLIEVPGDTGVYALREGGGRYSFPVRRMDRVVPLPWMNVAERVANARQDDQAAAAARVKEEEDLLGALDEWSRDVWDASPAIRERGAWFLLARVLPESLEPPKDWVGRLRQWYLDPTPLGIRRDGPTFLRPEWSLERRPGRRSARSSGSLHVGRKIAEFTDRGELRYATGLGRWGHVVFRDHGGAVPAAVLSFELVELVVSCLTVFGALWSSDAAADRKSTDGRAWVGISMRGTAGLALPPGRHDSISAMDATQWNPAPEGDPPPVVVGATLPELVENPHRLAWRLLRIVYQDFGYEESAIPYFDAKRGRFEFDF